ncbi:MAG: long-chain fatty acid--CoA ligase [Streptosporangiaceae bacterium]|nr:long-chain fatty acid--CoA ligase [Streptosporangiaceae bacterium]MBV9854764.1 long-chain fatty acid--CoA ligase [Streptosporangiaceae bacterium]
MRSTMMDIPLTVTSIMRYGTTAFGDSEVVTSTGDGVRRRRYAEAGLRAARLASALRRLGVDGDQRIGTYMWNNAEHLEAYMAVPSMGAVLHTLNIRLSCTEVGYIASHAGDYAVIVDASLVPAFAEVLPHAPDIRHVIVTGAAGTDASVLAGPGRAVHRYEELLSAEPDSFGWPQIDERSAAAMCYTSGTTGRPKGVAYSHRSTYLHSMGPCLGNSFGFSERDRVLPVVPMFHANAWGMPYAALLCGAPLVMTDRFMQPAVVTRLIEAERVTIGAGVPTIWLGVLAHVREHGGDLSSLRALVAGGSAVPHALMAAYEEEFGVRLVQAWGMTETSPLGSVAHPPAGVTGEEAWEYRDTAGRLFCTIEGRLSGDGGQVLPSDGKTVGELEVRGPWITGSYYRDDDPAKFHDGWLRTGDVGTLDQAGFIRLTDRAKDVIKSGGEWISSMELENLLMAHPSVAEAAVIGVPDEKWGERPLATVVLRPGCSASAAELRSFLGERVIRWQLPERWAFVDEVPKTSVGKFQKTRLRELYASGALDVTLVKPEARAR